MKTNEVYKEKYLAVINHIEEFMNDPDISEFDKKHAAISFAVAAISDAGGGQAGQLGLMEIAKQRLLDKFEALEEAVKQINEEDAKRREIN